MKKSNEEQLQEHLARVRAAMAKLQEHHLGWCINAALTTYVDQLRRTEEEIIRHERFNDRPLVDKYAGVTSRAEEIARLKASLPETEAIIDFLRAMHELQSHTTSVRWATDLGAYFASNKNRKVAKV